MKRHRVAAVRIWILGLLIGGAPASLRADPVTTAAPQLVVLQASQPDLPMTLSAGTIRGELTATSLSAVYSKGASAFVQLALTSRSGGKKGEAVELLLQTEQSEIAGVTGAVAESEEDGAARRVHIEGIRSGRSRKLLIEVKLHGSESKPASRLMLTLRTSDFQEAPVSSASKNATGEKTVTLEWQVSDCAGRFHAALHRIADEGGSTLRDLWRNASRPDKEMSRRWMFRPAVPKRQSRRERLADEREGVSTKQARRVYLEADRLTSAGYDPSLRERGEFGWMIDKVAGDLKTYLSQEPNPAICTGVEGFTAYYEKKLSPLGERGERLAKLAEDAERIARDKAEAVLSAVREMPGGHPAWGGGSLAALKPLNETPRDFKALLTDLLHSVNYPQEKLEKIEAAGSAYHALEILDEAGLDEDGVPKSIRAELRASVAAIEAALRLDSFRERHEALWKGFNGSLEAIRHVHGKACICKG
jgi:hypothetical protein